MKVKFVPQNVEFEIKPGESVMHLAQDNGLYIKSVCKGVPSCAECRVRVTEGDYNVMPPGSEELSLIGSGHFIDRRRLSCQLKCFGDVTIDMTEQLAKQNGLTVGKKKKLVGKDDRVEQAVVRRSEVPEGEESLEGAGPDGGGRGPRDNRGGGGGDRGPRENRGGSERGPRGGGTGGGPRGAGATPGNGPQQARGPTTGASAPSRPGEPSPRPQQMQQQHRPQPTQQGQGPAGESRDGGARKRRRRRGKGGGGSGSGAPGGGTNSAPSRPSI
jgi:2Fe-2S ferredoxin